MAARRIPGGAMRRLWDEHGVGLCAEAQADGVPCTELGKSCETCEHALAAYLETHAAATYLPQPTMRGEPENGA
jgi:hypothetical protein